MSEAKPYPKSQQLARGPKRYRRKVASPKQWAAISAAKIGPCRVCGSAGQNGRVYGLIQLHHLVPRDLGGDDLAENIVPALPGLPPARDHAKPDSLHGSLRFADRRRVRVHDRQAWRRCGRARLRGDV